ncbi:MAG: DUF669 domain-containing protein [Desulfobacteraceae bacterium]|jgi:hypothetical protein
MAQLNANLTNYESETGFDVLPPGWYHAKVIDSAIKQGNKGPYINWTYEIVGRPNRVWDIMSTGNEFSMKRLKSLAVCAGHPNPNFIADTEELHGKEFLVQLKIEKDPSGQYGDKNKASGFKPLDAGKEKTSVASPAAGQQPASEQTQQVVMPWDKA